MTRRAPIDSVGAHRPETVAGRLATELADNLNHLSRLETHMPDTTAWSDVLARFDNVVAVAGNVQQAAQDAVTAEVASRVEALEAALGITPDPQPADPNPPV